MKNLFRFGLFGLLFCLLCAGASAEDVKCDLCGKLIHGKYYILDDHANGGKKNFCPECGKIDARCFMCGLPVRPDARRLADGRFVCARDAHEAPGSDAEAREICNGVRQDVDRLLARFLTMPDGNVMLSMVDKFHLESLFKSPGYEHSCVSIFGATQTQPIFGGKFVHSISILSDLKKSRLMAVCAHEYTHAWMGENVKPERKAAMSPDTVEGFCELVAYKYMDSRHETYEMQNIRTSDYTKGQIAVLIEAENHYGFNSVVDWIKFGEDGHLEMNSLERVRAVQPGRESLTPSAPVLLAMQNPTPVAAPTTLLLKGISGTAQKRFALINDGTFERMEKGRVRLGQTNVNIQCLEIRSDSVVIQAEGSSAKQELFIRKP